MCDLLAQDPRFVGVHYGASRSGASPSLATDRADYEAHFASQETLGKRPDVLVYRRADVERLRAAFVTADGCPALDHLELISDDDIPLDLVKAAVAAIEVENSTYYAKKMAKFGVPGRRPRDSEWPEHWPYLAPSYRNSVPNIFLKEEDRARLSEWAAATSVKLFAAALFPDLAFLVDLREYDRAVAAGAIYTVTYPYSNREQRVVHLVPYFLGHEFADVAEECVVEATVQTSSSGKITSGVVFRDGSWTLRGSVLDCLESPEPVPPVWEIFEPS